jgi:hypothetical protein
MTSFSPTNMPVADVTLTVAAPAPATGAERHWRRQTDEPGLTDFLLEQSVTPRTPLCISVRFHSMRVVVVVWSSRR